MCIVLPGCADRSDPSQNSLVWNDPSPGGRSRPAGHFARGDDYDPACISRYPLFSEVSGIQRSIIAPSFSGDIGLER